MGAGTLWPCVFRSKIRRKSMLNARWGQAHRTILRPFVFMTFLLFTKRQRRFKVSPEVRGPGEPCLRIRTGRTLEYMVVAGKKWFAALLVLLGLSIPASLSA